MSANSPHLEQARLFAEASRLHDAGQTDDAEKIYKSLLKKLPEHPFVHFNLGLLYQGKNLPDKSRYHYSKAIVAKPDFAEAYYNLGNLYKSQNNLGEALKFYEYAIKCNDKLVQAHYNHGYVLRHMGQLDRALISLQRALALRPNAETYGNIGSILHTQGKFNEALPYYEASYRLNPEDVVNLNNLGAVLSQIGKYEQAENFYKKVLELKADDMVAYGHYCILLKSMGRLNDAISKYQEGLARAPQNASMHTNLLLAMVYAPSIAPDEITSAAKEFDKNVTAPLLRTRKLDIDKTPDRKLRIGYVSPDFRNHAVNYFFEPLLKNHNRDQFEIFAYSLGTVSDNVTERLKTEFDHWRDIWVHDFDTAADMIETDKIDILVDLTGHTGDNGLLIFARKPAPIQVSWLGYPATTGMKAMDYRITDPYCEPVGMTEHLNVETLWRLPQIFCCYGGHESNPAVIDHPPSEDNGYITFGCFNNFAKVSDDVLKTWARIMDKVPNSRLLLEIAGIDGPKFRTDVESRIKASGLDPARVVLEPRRRENQFVLYNKIDIALDPFPCAGGTTSMDTAWMGVPFITLAGKHFVSRMGVTILTNIGLPELIAQNLDEYVDKAASLASDPDRLKAIRHNLRSRVEASPMMDQKAFARNIEDAYRGMWKKFCGAGSQTT